MRAAAGSSGGKTMMFCLMLAVAAAAPGCGAPHDGHGYWPPAYGYRPSERSGWPYTTPYRYGDDAYPRRYYDPGYRKRHDPCVQTKRGAPIIRELKWYHRKTERVC